MKTSIYDGVYDAKVIAFLKELVPIIKIEKQSGGFYFSYQRSIDRRREEKYFEMPLLKTKFSTVEFNNKVVIFHCHLNFNDAEQFLEFYSDRILKKQGKMVDSIEPTFSDADPGL